MEVSLDQILPFADGMDHPECPAWGLDGNFYAGGEGGQLYRINPNGSVEEFAATGGLILGICLDGIHNLYACDSKRRAVLRITPAGDVYVYSRGSEERPFLSPNGLAFDAYGNLYVTDSGEWGKKNGCLYRVNPGGKTEVISDALRENPNGLAIDPAGQYLYVVLSESQKIVRLRLPEDNASAPGEAEDVISFSQAIPDGMAFTEPGDLFIGCDAPNIIYHLSAAGKRSVFAEDWKRVTLASPTNLAFGGDGLRTLVIANYARTGVVQITMPIAGMKLNYPVFDR